MRREAGGSTESERLQFVVFYLADEEFAIEITRVREIIKMRKITHLPEMADFVEGIIDLRGEIIPIFDLGRRFNVQGRKDGDDRRIMIVDLDHETTVGLIVDGVEEVLAAGDDELRSVGEKIGSRKAEYIEQVLVFEERLIITLDLENLLTSEEKLNLQDITDELES